MIESRQSFLKGINRRFSRDESSDPNYFFTLQNARIFNRGDTGKVQRINGFTDFVGTGTDYTNVLDFINFQNNFVVLYEDATATGNFIVEVFDEDGVSQFSDNYAGNETDSGTLTRSDNTVFIAPHNKILTLQDGGWSLEDFVSEVPSVDGTNEDATGGAKAQATIEPTSAPNNAGLESKATAQIDIHKNNTPAGQTDEITVTVGANTTDTISIPYDFTEQDIAREIFWALRGESVYSDPGVTTDWNVSLIRDDIGFNSTSTSVYLTSVLNDTDRNTDRIEINGSSYLIPQGDRRTVRRNRGPGRFPEEGFNSIRNLVELKVSTAAINQPSGAMESASSFTGPLLIRFSNIRHTVRTENIVSTDTATDIANKIETALNADSRITDAFEVTRSVDEITLTAVDFGTRYNGEVSLKFNVGEYVDADQIFSYNLTSFAGGEEVDTNLALDSYTNYWYKARYKYIDGHLSEECFPIRLNTGASNINTIVFNTADRDLDGNRPDLQIFRKQEGGDFFLIDEVDITGDTTDYLDDGKLEKGPFEDTGLVWTRNHKAQTILDDRYVRANIIYNADEYTEIGDSTFTLGTTTTTSEESLPSNAKARLFVRPQYIDGTKGYFDDVGTIDINSADLIPTIQQNTALVNSDKTIDELGFYASYKPHGQEHIYKFNSMELANPNVATIQDSNFYPSSTRIFFGFKFLEVWAGTGYRGVFKVAGWDAAGPADEHGGFAYEVFDDAGPLGGHYPQTLEVEIFGLSFTYIRHAWRDPGNESDTAIYKMADFEAVKRAVSTGDLKIRLTGSNIGTLSTTRPDDELYNTKVGVKSLIDTSSQYSDVDILNKEEDVLIGPLDTRLYLELENSPLDDIDNKNVTGYAIKRDYSEVSAPFPSKFDGFPRESEDLSSFSMSFEFTNFKKKEDAEFIEYTGDEAANDGGQPETGAFGSRFFRYNWLPAVYELTSVDFIQAEDALIFIGRKENEVDASPIEFDVTGLEFRDEDALQYNNLLESNIYETPVFKTDLNLNKTEYQNQLVWSNTLRNLNGFSGGRTFNSADFFNIGNENGEILDIETLGNKLYVFCENGLAVVNVGEVLTTQKQGEVFVDSSTFMTNYYWINDKLVSLKRESIVKYKNTIFFTDGYDVYMLTPNGLENITQGVIELDPDSDYYGTINPEFSEYQLCDYSSNETWAFNLEFSQWYGPFTYNFKSGSYIGHSFVTVDDSLYEHDTGNTFDGSTFTTLVQSVANDTDKSFYDKNFRKFYIESNNDSTATFKYGKDANSLVNSDISDMIVKNGYKHQGIAPTESNAKNIFWDIETTDNNFSLSEVTYSFSVNRRR